LDRFLVSFDLLKSGQDYQALDAALRGLGAERVLLSVWAVIGNYSCLGLKERLEKFIDAHDRLLVVRVDDWSGVRLLTDVGWFWKA
jgi:hypothetical protein